MVGGIGPIVIVFFVIEVCTDSQETPQEGTDNCDRAYDLLRIRQAPDIGQAVIQRTDCRQHDLDNVFQNVIGSV